MINNEKEPFGKYPVFNDLTLELYNNPHRNYSKKMLLLRKWF